MKRLLITLFYVFFMQTLAAQTQSKLIASCCENKKARCTGSSSCSACKNCSRCGYCNSGGSCGACSSRNNYVAPNYSTRNTKKTFVSSKPKESRLYAVGEMLFVTNQILNLRKGPGTDYEILEVLAKNDRLKFLVKTGDWAKVVVQDTGTIGYVHLKYVN